MVINMKYSCIKRYARRYRKDASYEPLDGGWGWIIVLTAVINQASFAYVLSVFSLLFPEKLQEIGSGSTGATMVVTTISVMIGVSGLINGPLIKYVSYQVSAMSGGILAFLGYVTAYFVTDLWHLVIGLGVLYGIGSGSILNANIIAINNYFENKKSWATGLAFAGGSVSQMVMPYVIAAMLQSNGYGGTVLLVGGICLNATVVSLLFHPLCDHSKINKDKNIDVELTEPLTGRKAQKMLNENLKHKKSVLQKIKNFFDLDILVNPAFINVTIFTAFILAANISSHLLIPLYLKVEVGLPLKGVALYISIRAAGDLICRVAVTWILSKLRVTARFAVWISAVILIISRSGLAAVSDLNIIYFLALVEGCGRGIFVPNMNLCYSEEFGKKQLPNAIGLSTFLRILGQFTIGALIGYVSDSSGSNATGIHAISVILLFGLITWVIEYAVYFIKNKKMKPLIKPKLTTQN